MIKNKKDEIGAREWEETTLITALDLIGVKPSASHPIPTIGTMMLCLPNGIDARGVGTGAADFLKIGIGVRPVIRYERQDVFADNPAEKSHIFMGAGVLRQAKSGQRE